MLQRLSTLVIALSWAFAGNAQQVADSGVSAPLPIRDQNPLLRPFYLPAPRSVPGLGLDVGLAVTWSNTVNLPHNRDESLYVDEETREVDWRAKGRLGDWLWAAELPLLWRGAGILDAPISNYHRLLGFNPGYRPYVADNVYRITYEHAGDVPVSVKAGTAVGDVPIEAGRVLYSAPGTELALWLGAKLPVGRVSQATGSGRWDESIWATAGRRFLDRWDIFSQVGLTHLGGPGEFARARSWLGFATLTTTWKWTERLNLLAQADVHTAVTSSDLAFLKPPVVGTFGLRWNPRGSWALAVGVQEDLATNRSPDMAFFFSLNHSAK